MNDFKIDRDSLDILKDLVDLGYISTEEYNNQVKMVKTKDPVEKSMGLIRGILIVLEPLLKKIEELEQRIKNLENK